MRWRLRKTLGGRLECPTSLVGLSPPRAWRQQGAVSHTFDGGAAYESSSGRVGAEGAGASLAQETCIRKGLFHAEHHPLPLVRPPGRRRRQVLLRHLPELEDHGRLPLS